jgi:hypothetical protein
MKATPLTWLASLLLCLGIGASHLLDAQEDRRAEWQQSASLQDAQRAAALLSNKERIAQAHCRQKYGEAIASFDADGQLICQPKRGQPAVIAQTGASQNPARAKGVRQQDETSLKAAAMSDAAAFTEIKP